MGREFTVSAGTAISVATTDNADGTRTFTVTNTAPSSGGTVTSVGAGTGISVTGTSSVPIVNVAASGVGAGTYGDSSHYATVTVDATGRVTAASSVALPASASVVAGTGISVSGGPAYTVSLTATGVTASTYGDATHVPQITVNAQGQITAVSNVAISGGSSVTVAGGAGISVTGGPAYTVEVAAATAHAVMLTTGSPGFTSVTPGAAGTVLTSNGATSDPSYQAVPAAQTNSQFTSHIGGSTVTLGSSVGTLDSLTVTVASGQVVLAWATLHINDNANDGCNGDITVDSTSFSTLGQSLAAILTNNGPVSHPLMRRFTGLSAGTHTIRLLASNATHNGAANVEWTLMAMVVSG